MQYILDKIIKIDTIQYFVDFAAKIDRMKKTVLGFF